MKAARRVVVGGLVVMLVMWATGCGSTEAKDMEIQSVRDRLNKAEQELQEKNDRLRALQAERDQLAAQASNLERQLKEAMAAGGTGIRETDDFTKYGAFSYAEVGEDVLFDSGRAAIKDTGKAKLQSIARQIEQIVAKREGKATVFVIGHTDTDPIKHTADKWIDNLDLSVNRGANVSRELYRLGVNTKSVLAGGQGEYNPTKANNTKEGKQANRRVQIIIGPPMRPSVEAPTERSAASK